MSLWGPLQARAGGVGVLVTGNPSMVRAVLWTASGRPTTPVVRVVAVGSDSISQMPGG